MWFDSMWSDSIRFWFGSIWCGLIRLDVIRFDSTWFVYALQIDLGWSDLVRCDSSLFQLIQFDLVLSWCDCAGSMWFDLDLIHVIQCHSVWFDWFDLTKCFRVTRFDLFRSFSMRFDLIDNDLIVVGSICCCLAWWDPSDSSLTWLVFTWFYEVGVDSISFCLIQVSSMLVDLILFECWWFYSIWFALIRFDLIRLAFCENMYVSAMCLHFHMFYRISDLLARLAQNAGLAAPIMTFWALLIWLVVESESHIQRTLLKLIRNPICFLYELSHRRLWEPS